MESFISIFQCIIVPYTVFVHSAHFFALFCFIWIKYTVNTLCTNFVHILPYHRLKTHFFECTHFIYKWLSKNNIMCQLTNIHWFFPNTHTHASWTLVYIDMTYFIRPKHASRHKTNVQHFLKHLFCVLQKKVVKVLNDE